MTTFFSKAAAYNTSPTPCYAKVYASQWPNTLPWSAAMFGHEFQSGDCTLNQVDFGVVFSSAGHVLECRFSTVTPVLGV